MGYNSNIPSFKASFDKNNKAFLKAFGLVGVTSMKKRCPVGKSYGGTLRQDIGYDVDLTRMAVYMGNTLDYSLYVNKGTGIFVAGGRNTPWVYFDPKTGNYYKTNGQQPQPYIMEGFEKVKSEAVKLYANAMKGFK